MALDVPQQRFLLLTYPRTASNLLVKILALDDQPSLLPNRRKEYYFMPIIRAKMHQFRVAGKHLDEWTADERTRMMKTFQKCFDTLQKHAEIAEVQGKDAFVKEHVPWLVEPVAETKWIFGEESIEELPWTVKALPEQTHSILNPTMFPDQVLKTWFPTFLIRHPALVFPSMYRTDLNLQGAGVKKSEVMRNLEMTMRWSRILYDWYTQEHSQSESSLGDDVTWPIILDADDIMTEPELVMRYSKILGFDESKLRFLWEPASKEEWDKMHRAEKAMRSTIAASAGIVEGKTSVNVDIDEEAKKWRSEFGNEDGEKMEKWVRAAMPDYEYMKTKRLRP